MAIKFDNVVEGYDMLNSDLEYSSVAYICLETGEVLWHSRELDGPDELPDDIESDKYIGLPRRNDLDLGSAPRYPLCPTRRRPTTPTRSVAFSRARAPTRASRAISLESAN